MAASKLQNIALRCHSGLGDNAHRHRCERSGTGCVKCRSQEEVLCLGQECIGLVLPKRTAVRLMKTSDITAATSSRPSNSQQTCSCCRYHVKFPLPPWHHYLFPAAQPPLLLSRYRQKVNKNAYLSALPAARSVIRGLIFSHRALGSKERNTTL